MGWTTSKIVYLSGPMTGLPGHNYPEFNKHAARLRKDGYMVINPAENFNGQMPTKDRPRAEYMRVDIQSVLRSHIVAVLPGWPSSAGALLEVATAQECGIAVVDALTMKPLPRWIKVRARYEDIGEFVPGEKETTPYCDSQIEGPRESEGID